jgi:hypothetical protein
LRQETGEEEMTATITNLSQATPQWLTGILRENKHLPTGEITHVNQRSNTAFNSSVGHLEVTYSAQAPADSPTRLLLKLNGNEDGENEIGLYKIAQSNKDRLPMLPPCYAAEYDPTSGNSILLLGDVSQTHAAPLSRTQLIEEGMVPTDLQLDQMIDALAGLHAWGWQHPSFGKTGNVSQVRWYRDKINFEAHITRRRRDFDQFLGIASDKVPTSWLDLYRQILDGLPGLWSKYFEPRVLTFKNLTYTEGDAYVTQYLTPKTSGNGAAYLVDYQDAFANFGAFDLVHLLATFWTPAQRHQQQREERLLRRYLEILQKSGVKEYTWVDLISDYRLMLIIIVLVPVWDAASGASQSYWYPKMNCLIDNFNDFDCLIMFDSSI